MKAGAADRKLRVCEKTFKQFCEDAKAAPHAWSGITRKHKQLRARRKRLIREALEAATEEYWNAYEDGEKEGVKALAEAEAERDRLNAEWRKEQK